MTPKNTRGALALVGVASVVYFSLPRETRRRLMAAVVDLVAVLPSSSSTGNTVDLAAKYPNAIDVEPKRVRFKL